MKKFSDTNLVLKVSSTAVSLGRCWLVAGTSVGLAWAGLASSASAQISGFTAGQYTLNSGTAGGDAGAAGAGAINNGILTVTNTTPNSEANSAFYNTAQNISRGFTASFTYQNVTGGGADGATFCLTSTSGSAAVVGSRGNGLGWGVGDSGTFIANSAALELIIFVNGSGNQSLTNVQTQGFLGATVPGTGLSTTTGINLAATNPVAFTLNYNGTTLSELLRDTVTGVTYTQNFPLDLVGSLGTNTAYVGFTGGTGGFTANQTFSNFTFTPVPEPSTWAILAGGVCLLGVIKMRNRSRVFGNA